MLIKDYMCKHFSVDKIQFVLAEAEANAAILLALTLEQHLTINLKYTMRGFMILLSVLLEVFKEPNTFKRYKVGKKTFQQAIEVIS